jgi:hypothetical protein
MSAYWVQSGKPARGSQNVMIVSGRTSMDPSAWEGTEIGVELVVAAAALLFDIDPGFGAPDRRDCFRIVDRAGIHLGEVGVIDVPRPGHRLFQVGERLRCIAGLLKRLRGFGRRSRLGGRSRSAERWSGRGDVRGSRGRRVGGVVPTGGDTEREGHCGENKRDMR